MRSNPVFAKRVFFWAGVYGLIVLLPLYFLEHQLGRAFPPPLTHPENYYAFVDVALAWQLALIVISRDPVRFRPVMIPALAEKLLSALTTFVLYFASRAPAATMVFAIIDLALGALYLVAFRRCRSDATESRLWPTRAWSATSSHIRGG
jgi:hypothetical protein